MSEYLIYIEITLELEDERQITKVALDLKEFEAFHEFLSILSKKLNFKITTNKFHVKMQYEQTWVNLIDLKSFYFFISNDINLNNQPKLLLKLNKNDHQIDFNLKGEKFQNNKFTDSNRPNMKIYHKENAEVQCAFCKESSKDDYKLTKLGPFYGPVKKGANCYYFHELCAIWSPNVYLIENNKLTGLANEIKRANKLKCSYCGIRGAATKCYLNKCDNDYHVLCAKSIGCYFNNQEYIIFCPDHINSRENKYYVKPKINCETASNLSDCVCEICQSGLDEDKLLECDKCKSWLHTYCNEPEILGPLDSIEFNCFKCVNKE